ncbi:hypothetical protein CEXT_238941 [Caerostris extrusa]|uniref:Uncharacterized protein n=1 Tax=Caerostris extrusa TaxID=172846 RepID=A0AAV4R8P5_CAEEX|nr:hypothetical protein CEXT_238941 [Caerostris extrusa]
MYVYFLIKKRFRNNCATLNSRDFLKTYCWLEDRRKKKKKKLIPPVNNKPSLLQLRRQDYFRAMPGGVLERDFTLARAGGCVRRGSFLEKEGTRRARPEHEWMLPRAH